MAMTNQTNRAHKLHIAILGFLLFIAGNTYAQQEPIYSQYMFNMAQVNPAYAGNRAANSITALFRKQWVNVPGSPSTGYLTWDTRNKGSNVGYGIQVFNDHIGLENSLGAKGLYSFRIPLNKSFLSFGLSAGVVNYRVDLRSAMTTEGGDPMFQENVNRILPTAGVGVIFATKSFYAGLSAPAILETKVSTNKAPITTSASNHYFLTTGYIFELSEAVKLKPSIMAKGVLGAPMSFDYNMNVWILDMIGVGASYRMGDAIIGIFELQLSSEFRLGYAYDYSISTMNTFSKGTHELMLRYEFSHSKSEQILSPRYY
jgi:type IX secretion system PorP/SprF family membrane protein